MNRRTILVSVVAAVAVVSTVVIAATRQSSAAQSEQWVGTWADAQHAAATSGLTKTGFNNQTIRMTVRTSVGGDAARIRLSNAFGTKPLVIGDVTVAAPAVATATAALKSGSTHDVTFVGRHGVTILPGAQIISDPIDMDVSPLSELTVSIWLPTPTGPTTWHTVSRATSYMSEGDHTADTSDGNFTPIGVPNPIPGNTDSPWFYLSGVDVRTADSGGAIVVFGDSISDGWRSTLDANHRWPDDLANRLVALPADRHAPSVLDMSLSGNALGHQTPLVPQVGPNALSRVQRDVLSQTGVKTVILELGINDILLWGDTAGNIVGELHQVALQLHEAGLRVVVCTLMPFEGFRTWTEAGDKERMAVNSYIRSTSDFDAVVDLDSLMRDVDEPARLTHKYDSGDHVHPNDLGYQTIANAMPLDVLVPKS